MKKIFIYAAVAFSITFFYNCKDASKTDNTSLTKEITFKKEGELSLMKANSDSLIVKLDIEIADDEYQTQTGLMYRKSMDKDHGMLFIFNNSEIRSFYMKNTEFPLDIIYFNSEKEIISIQKNAKPFNETSLPSDAPSQYVLEVNGGLADAWNLEKGDKFEYRKI